MKKRILGLLLSVVITISLIPSIAFAITAQEGADWALAQVGKSIDFDGVYGAQCVDLIKKYCNTFWGWTPTCIYTGGAKDYASIPLPNSSWTRIQNTPEFIPQPGDIAIWNSGTYGHVAIIISANISSFVSVDQNWYNSNSTVGSPAAKVTHNYSGFWGVIRPPFSSSSVETNQPVHASSSATIRDGYFTFKNVSSGTFMNVWDGKDENSVPVTTYTFDSSVDQRFNVVHKGNGKYKLYAECSSSGTNRVVDIYRNGSAPSAGQSVDLWTPNDDTAQLFYIVPLDDGSYVFELAAKDGYVIAPANASVAASNSKSSQLTLQKYTGESYQKWKTCNNNGKEITATGYYGTGTYQIDTDGDSVNLRNGASASYSKIGSIPDKTKVTVTAVDNNWGYTTYNGVSGWFCLDYTIFNVEVTSIAVASEPRTKTYFVGEELDITNLSVNVSYNDNSVKNITSGFTTSYDFSTPGAKTVTVSYSGKSTTFNVDVEAVEISDLSITTPATKTIYYVGDTLDTSGLSLTAAYNNGTVTAVTSGFTADYDFSNAGEKKVEIFYDGLSVSYNVTVEEKGYANVTVSADKQTAYYSDEIIISFDLTNTKNIYDGNFNILYDNKVLEAVDYTVGKTLEKCNTAVNTSYESDKIRVTFAGTEELSTGNLLKVTFKLITDKVSNTTISIDSINMYTVSGSAVTTETNSATLSAVMHDYTITDMYFLDSSDNETDKFPSNGEFYVGVKFNKNTEGTERPNIIFALYNSTGRLIDVKIVQNRYAYGDDLACETNFSVNSKYNIFEIKTFIWNSVTGLTPLSNVAITR